MSEPTTKKQDKKLNAVTTQLINATVRHVVQLIIDDAEIRQHLNDVLMEKSGGTISIVTRARPRKPGKKGGKA